MSFHDLATMTWPEAARLRERDDAVGVIPVGALEQHGPHLPMIMDSFHASALARGMAERLEVPVVVAPALAAGLSDHHVAFPGTVTLSEPVFGGLITAYVEAMERIGIGRVAVVSGHGGNFAFIGRLAREYEGHAEVIAYDDLQRFIQVMFDAGRATGLTIPETDIHAGVAETSVAMALFEPRLVHDFAELSGYVNAAPGWLERMFEHGIHSLSDNGILGDPRGANAVAGLAIVDALIQELAQWVCTSFGIAIRSGQNERRTTSTGGNPRREHGRD